jgi:mRNA interferase YafQ
MRTIRQVNSFKRDLKKIKKRSKDLDKLYLIVEKLSKDIDLDSKNRPHKLSGNYAEKWECHIEPDWLLIYEVTDDLVILYRTGTHSDLFT